MPPGLAHAMPLFDGYNSTGPIHAAARGPEVNLHTGPITVRVRLEGTLDAVRASDRTFALRLADGRELPGHLVRGTAAGLGRVLGRPLLVFGTAALGPAGEVASIEADGYIPNDGRPWKRRKADSPLSPEVAAEVARRWDELRRTRPELFTPPKEAPSVTPTDPLLGLDSTSALEGQR